MFEAMDPFASLVARTVGSTGRATVPLLELDAGHEPQPWPSLEWLDEAPGASPTLLAEALDDARGRLGDLCDGDLLRLVIASERLTSWAQAVQVEAIAELSRRPVLNPAGRHVMDGRSLTIAEIGPALGLARYSATRRVDLAEHLTTALTATLAALRQGRIDKTRAQIISDELATVPDLAPADRATIEQDALAAAAAGRTPSQVRDRIRRAVLAVNPTDAAERHQQARQQRRVWTTPQPDGMGELWGYLPAETITMIETVLNGYADTAHDHPTGKDTRSHDERRADALTDIFQAILDGNPISTTPGPPPIGTAPGAVAQSGAAHGGSAQGAAQDEAARDEAAREGAAQRPGNGGAPGGVWMPPPLPTRQRRRPHLIITIAASTLAGTDDQPATLAGYGPVPADLARRLAADAGTHQTACVDDTTGACQWTGKSTPYRPAQWMVDQVVARDPVCRHPGCRRPAVQCEVDHAERHPDGPTCPCNLMPLCAFHHHLKHNGGWQAERITTPRDGIPTGTVIWTSPLDRTYHDPPVPLMPPAPRPSESRPPKPDRSAGPPF